ncbi:hypothetical protein ACFLUO_05255 [Chloroflexota bacterium]
MKLRQQINRKKQKKSGQNDGVQNAHKNITASEKGNKVKNNYNSSSNDKHILKILSILALHIPSIGIDRMAQDIKRIISGIVPNRKSKIVLYHRQ